MSEPGENSKSLPKAKIRKSRRSWWLWLIPLGAVALCVWFIYRDYIATGPLVTIYFQDASGLEENNTQVRYLGAIVGQVKAIQLTTDNKGVQVKARLAGFARHLARSGSVFWIVRPEVKLGAISGLRTIISGEYVAVRPGNGPRTNNFVGAEKEPAAEQPGALHLTLLTSNLGSLQEQSTIYYRGIQVGEVLKFQLADDAQGVVLQARILQPYAPLVRENTKFWNAGIEFNTPAELGRPATDGAVFRLYDKPDDAWKNWMPAIKLNLPEQAPEMAQPTNQPTPLNAK
jgi:paraquat-inducible protein B